MEIPRHWRLKAQRYRLVGSSCPVCGQLTFPPHPVCTHCAAQMRRIAIRGISGLPPAILTLDADLLKER